MHHRSRGGFISEFAESLGSGHDFYTIAVAVHTTDPVVDCTMLVFDLQAGE
jgi:hypothetical protein